MRQETLQFIRSYLKTENKDKPLPYDFWRWFFSLPFVEESDYFEFSDYIPWGKVENNKSLTEKVARHFINSYDFDKMERTDFSISFYKEFGWKFALKEKGFCCIYNNLDLENDIEIIKALRWGFNFYDFFRRNRNKNKRNITLDFLREFREEMRTELVDHLGSLFSYDAELKELFNNIEILEEFKEDLNWRILCATVNLKEEVVEKFFGDKITVGYVNGYLNVSEDFILKHKKEFLSAPEVFSRVIERKFLSKKYLFDYFMNKLKRIKKTVKEVEKGIFTEDTKTYYSITERNREPFISFLKNYKFNTKEIDQLLVVLLSVDSRGLIETFVLNNKLKEKHIMSIVDYLGLDNLNYFGTGQLINSLFACQKITLTVLMEMKKLDLIFVNRYDNKINIENYVRRNPYVNEECCIFLLDYLSIEETKRVFRFCKLGSSVTEKILAMKELMNQ